MGLSTKQVSSDGLDWSRTLLQAQSFELPKPPVARRQQQQNQEQPEQLQCPRCESTNTKFCYYNNYNKSQPRHFCRACKRHWTKGGTLRNVPVGGHGRKNKRTRKSSSSSSAVKTTTNGASTNATTTRLNNTNLAFDLIDGVQRLNTHLAIDGEQRLSTHMGVLLPQQNLITSSELDNHIFSSPSGLSTTTKPFNFLQGGRAQVLSFPFSSSSTSSSFDTISTSFQSPIVYNYPQEFKVMEEPIITSIMPSTTTTIPQPNNPSAGIIYTSNNDWNWEDIETLVSTDLNVPWDDSDMNP